MLIFIIGLLLGAWLAAAGMVLLLLYEPKPKELTKEEWKAGFRQK